ncbi:MAG: GIY-YIG nuclease family protein [Bacteroidota bacterium]
MYILQSENSGRYYIGHTSDSSERVSYHNNGRVKATRNKGPWRVVYSEKYETKNQANQREFEIKKKKSRKYIEFLINDTRE